MVPLRLRDALKSDELSTDAYAVANYLAAAADADGVMITTLRELAEGMKWRRKSPDTLRRCLAQLKAGGWISYDVRERQSTYTIQLTALRVATAAEPAPEMQQPRAAMQQLADPPIPAAERLSAADQLRLFRSELRQEEKTPDKRGPRTPATRRLMGWCDNCGAEGVVTDDGQIDLCDDCMRAHARAQHEVRA